MRINEKARQIEIWDFFMNDQNMMFGYTPPNGKTWTIEKFNQLNMIYPFLLKEYNLLAKILRALVSNKNGILHFWIKSIIQ